MTRYLVLHALLSVAIGLLLYGLRNAQPRLRFRIAFLGVMLWAIPIPMITIPVSKPQNEGYYNFFYELAVSPAGITTPQASGFTFSLMWVFVALSIAGLAFWQLSLVNHHRQVAQLKRTSRDGNHLWEELGLIAAGDLRIIPGTGAMTTGVFKPVVFIGEAHVEGDELESVLVHEGTHIRQNDNAWIFGINLLERFFWWNPLLLYLSARARFYIELSCDQICRARLGLDRYRTALAEMMLRSIGLATPISSPLVAPLVALRKENIQRIKVMDKPFSTPARSALALSIFAVICTAMVVRPVSFDTPERVIVPVEDTKQERIQPQPTVQFLEEPMTIPRVGQEGVAPPVFLKRVAPVYPERALKIKLQGYVIAEAIMGKDGQIRDMKILRGLGKGKFGFEEAAMDALKQWEYIPGKVGDKPADVRMTLKIDFVLQ